MLPQASLGNNLKYMYIIISNHHRNSFIHISMNHTLKYMRMRYIHHIYINVNVTGITLQDMFHINSMFQTWISQVPTSHINNMNYIRPCT